MAGAATGPAPAGTRDGCAVTCVVADAEKESKRGAAEGAGVTDDDGLVLADADNSKSGSGALALAEMGVAEGPTEPVAEGATGVMTAVAGRGETPDAAPPTSRLRSCSKSALDSPKEASRC
jgi:hypothetical protein